MISIFHVVLISDTYENAINNGKHFVLFHFRSSHPEVFCKKGVIRNFAKFTGKYLCRSLFSKVAGLRPFFIKKETLTQVFSCEFCEMSKNTSGGYICHLSKYFDKFMVTLVIRCKFKWAVSFKYQLHLYLPRFQNFIFQDFLGTPYINW